MIDFVEWKHRLLSVPREGDLDEQELRAFAAAVLRDAANRGCSIKVHHEAGVSTGVHTDWLMEQADAIERGE